MTDNQLAAARGALKLIELREANRISHLSDVIPEYSDRFNDKIERLIASERKREASVLKLPLKKKILILVAAMVIALAYLVQRSRTSSSRYTRIQSYSIRMARVRTR